MSFLEALPEEVLLQLMRYLKPKDLLKIGLASAKMRKVSHDPKLWQKVDVNDKIVPTEFIEFIYMFVKYLDISLAVTEGKTWSRLR